MKNMLNRVPEVVIFFWIIKILATTVGETAADFLNDKMGLGLSGTSYVMGGLLVIVLLIQFIVIKRYVPAVYWIAVVLMSIVGTLITDNLVENLGISLETTTIVFRIVLRLVLVFWNLTRRQYFVLSFFPTREEWSNWATTLLTFALGTP